MIVCNYCEKEVAPIIMLIPDGEWKKMKAECPLCHRYIKILSKKEKEEILAKRQAKIEAEKIKRLEAEETLRLINGISKKAKQDKKFRQAILKIETLTKKYAL